MRVSLWFIIWSLRVKKGGISLVCSLIEKLSDISDLKISQCPRLHSVAKKKGRYDLSSCIKDALEDGGNTADSYQGYPYFGFPSCDVLQCDLATFSTMSQSPGHDVYVQQSQGLFKRVSDVRANKTAAGCTLLYADKYIQNAEHCANTTHEYGGNEFNMAPFGEYYGTKCTDGEVPLFIMEEGMVTITSHCLQVITITVFLYNDAIYGHEKWSYIFPADST